MNPSINRRYIYYTEGYYLLITYASPWERCVLVITSKCLDAVYVIYGAAFWAKHGKPPTEIIIRNNNTKKKTKIYPTHSWLPDQDVVFNTALWILSNNINSSVWCGSVRRVWQDGVRRGWQLYPVHPSRQRRAAEPQPPAQPRHPHRRHHPGQPAAVPGPQDRPHGLQVGDPSLPGPPDPL